MQLYDVLADQDSLTLVMEYAPGLRLFDAITKVVARGRAGVGVRAGHRWGRLPFAQHPSPCDPALGRPNPNLNFGQLSCSTAHLLGIRREATLCADRRSDGALTRFAGGLRL